LIASVKLRFDLQHLICWQYIRGKHPMNARFGLRSAQDESLNNYSLLGAKRQLIWRKLFVIAFAASIASISGVTAAHAALTHRYSFTTDASDSVGSANGTFENGATVTGGQLQLATLTFQPHGGPDLSLPASILPASGSVTIEQWFTFQGSGFFTEAYAFTNNANDTNPPGANNGQYLMHAISAPQGGPSASLTPAAGGSHIAQTTNGYAGGPETDAFETTQGIGAGGGGYLDDGATYMAATVIDGGAGTLSYYVFRTSDGAGGLQQTIPANPLSSYSFTNAYLGRSPFLGDNSTSGTVDEFRIYTDPRSGAQIAADFAAGPNTLVPEPASLSLAALGALSLVGVRLLRRNRKFEIKLA
jgi:hypothetical protein